MLDYAEEEKHYPDARGFGKPSASAPRGARPRERESQETLEPGSFRGSASREPSTVLLVVPNCAPKYSDHNTWNDAAAYRVLSSDGVDAVEDYLQASTLLADGAHCFVHC